MNGRVRPLLSVSTRDSETMLLYYSYVDTVGARRDGYFWYNCVSGETDAVLELDAK